MELKVLSFNIAHGMGMDGIVNLERAARVIEESEADLIGLQEVDCHFSARSDFEDQVSWFGERLGMQAAFGANLDFEPETEGKPRRQYGNAVLSRFPIKYAQNHRLTSVPTEIGSDEQRGLLETVIDVEETFLHFFNTHLSLKEEELAVNVREVMDEIGQSRFPVVLTGDFNAPPSNRSIRELREAMEDTFHVTGNKHLCTYPAPYENAETGEHLKPASRIDYIYSGQGVVAGSSEAIVTDVSDHLPIIAELTVHAAAGKPAAKLAK